MRKFIETIHIEGNPYLTKVELFPWKWWPLKRRFIHIFHRPDGDRVCHDHPRSFSTLVLWGGYDEVSLVMDWQKEKYIKDDAGKLHSCPTGGQTFDTLRWLSFRRRAATHAHRITRLHTKYVLTFVVLGGKEGEWGFWFPPYLHEYRDMGIDYDKNNTDQWKWVNSVDCFN